MNTLNKYTEDQFLKSEDLNKLMEAVSSKRIKSIRINPDYLDIFRDGVRIIEMGLGEPFFWWCNSKEIPVLMDVTVATYELEFPKRITATEYLNKINEKYNVYRFDITCEQERREFWYNLSKIKEMDVPAIQIDEEDYRKVAQIMDRE
jgi:hypothetical protein